MIFSLFSRLKIELNKRKTEIDNVNIECKIVAIGEHTHNFFTNTRLMAPLALMEGSVEHILQRANKEIKIHFLNMIGMEEYKSLRDNYLKDSQIILVFPNDENEARKLLNILKDRFSGCSFLIVLKDKNDSNDITYTIFDKDLHVHAALTRDNLMSLTTFFETVWSAHEQMQKPVEENKQQALKK